MHSAFLTVQGEGSHAGRRAVFVRFSGCNVWDGVEEHRERDAAANSPCASICDTVFRGVEEENGGGYFTASELGDRVRALWGFEGNFHVVLTGGEPALQIDEYLVSTLKSAGAFIAVETNGSRRLPEGLDHVCVSPKPPVPVINQHYDELKLLYPLYADFINEFKDLASIRWLQPVDCGQDNVCGTIRCIQACVSYVQDNLGWGISVQTHKVLNVE